MTPPLGINSRTPGIQAAHTMTGILQLANADPQKAIKVSREELERQETGYRKALYRSLAVAFVVATLLRDRPDEAKWLLDDPIWRGTRQSLSNPLLLVLKYLYRGLEKGPRYERARSHAKALKRAFEANVSPEQVEEWIEENGGLNYLARHHVSGSEDLTSSGSGGAGAQPLRTQAADDEFADELDDPSAADACSENLDDDSTDETDENLDNDVINNGHQSAAPWDRPGIASPDPSDNARGARYSRGAKNKKRVEILVDPDLFDSLMQLGIGEGLAVSIYRVENGDSAYIRLDGDRG